MQWMILFFLIVYFIRRMLRKAQCRENGHKWVEYKHVRLRCARCKVKQKNLSVLKKARM